MTRVMTAVGFGVFVLAAVVAAQAADGGLPRRPSPGIVYGTLGSAPSPYPGRSDR
jgi:hypothetical protein